MSTLKYWILILIPPILIGGIAELIYVMNSQEIAQAFFMEAMKWNLLLYIPLIGFLRMKYLKFSWNEILLSLIPIFGIQYRAKRLFYSNKKRQ